MIPAIGKLLTIKNQDVGSVLIAGSTWFWMAFFGFVLFGTNAFVSLWDQDEAAYAGMALRMLETGNWLQQEFMWSFIHRKPPLHVWNIALSMKVFGVNEFAVRFPPSLYILLTLLMVDRLGSQYFGQRTSRLGMIILGTSLLVPALGKVSVTDGMLLFFSTLCAFSIILRMQGKPFYWVLIFWFSFSMALLTKGPPIVIFTGAFVLILLVFHPGRWQFIKFHPWIFIPLAAGPLLYWGYLMYQNGYGDMIDWMIDWYILRRVDGGVLGQTAPPGTHLLAMFVFFMCYLAFIPSALINAFRKFRTDHHMQFLVAWFLGGWFLYEWTPSKLPAYVVVAHVPLAILLASEIQTAVKTGSIPSRGLRILHWVIVLLLGMGVLVLPWILKAMLLVKIVFAIVGFGWIGAGIYLWIRGYNDRWFGRHLFYNLSITFCLWVALYPVAEGFKNSAPRIADYLSNGCKPESNILIGNTRGHPPSLPFYLGFTFDSISEEKDLDQLLEMFISDQPVVMILNNYQYRELKKKVSFSAASFSSQQTDREDKAQYFVVVNEAAKKNPGD